MTAWIISLAVGGFVLTWWVRFMALYGTDRSTYLGPSKDKDANDGR